MNADLLDGLSAKALQTRVTGTCRTGQAVTAVKADGSVVCAAVGAVIWNGDYGADGSPQAQHAGMTMTHTGTGTYQLTWTGFPGYAQPSIESLDSTPTVQGALSSPNGTGQLPFSFSNGDHIFWIALVQESH